MLFSESSKSGKLSCYEYSVESETLTFIQHIINLPLVDSTVLLQRKILDIRTVVNEDKYYELLVFFSDNLLGHINRIHPILSKSD